MAFDRRHFACTPSRGAREARFRGVSSGAFSGIVVALAFSLALGVSPLRADADSKELEAALRDGSLRAEAALIDSRRLRITLTNATAQSLRLTWSKALAALPPGVTRLPVSRAKDAEPPDLTGLMRVAQETVGAQAGVVCGRDGRGGFGGPLKLELTAGETRAIEAPFLATSLEKFRPDPETVYTLTAADSVVDDPVVKRFLLEMGQQSACYGVAQGVLWQLVHGAQMRQIRLIRHRDLNDDEAVLAEHLVSELRQSVARPGRPLEPIPARLYLKVINKAGGEFSALTAEIERLTETGGFLTLPVKLQSIEDFQPANPSQLATAVGCQMTLGGTADNVTVQVSLARWDGRTYKLHREVRVELGASPDARAALVKLESTLVANLIELKRAAPLSNENMHGVEIINHFPLTLRSLLLRRKSESTASARELTLTGYALGPGRRLIIDFDEQATQLEVAGAAWGR